MTVLLAALPVIAAIFAAFCGLEPKTNAKWLTWATGLRKGIERAGRWAHRPRLQRRVIQATVTFFVAETVYGLLTAPGVTVLAVILATVVLAAWGCAWAYRKARQHATVIGHVTLKDAAKNAPAVGRQWWNHHYGFTVRLRDSLAPYFGVTPWRLKLPPDLSRVDIRPPYTFAARADQMEGINATIATLVPVEGLEMAGSKLHGFSPRICYAQIEPPPRELYWDDRMAAICKSAKPHQLVIGIGHKGETVRASLEADSPHFGIGMGSGAGKSNLAAFFLVQRLMRGDIAIVLDGKRTSHPWAFKDMQANYDLLPNVAYGRRIDDIHHLLIFLGAELARRNEITEAGMDAKGRLIRGSIGARWFILAEEMNVAIPLLKSYWTRCRQADPTLDKQSPALAALEQISFAGRAVKMNIIFLGQRLDAEVFGCTPTRGGAVRGNVGVRCIARYDKNAWDVQTGGTPPMPPSPSVVGRVQAWIGGQVSECQVPFMDHKSEESILRDLATSGTVTECPAGMPGSRSVSVLDRPALPPAPSDQPIVLGKPAIPDNWVSISQAHAAGIFGARTLGAVNRASTRKGFPKPVKTDGRAYLYDFDQLAAWQAGKELVA